MISQAELPYGAKYVEGGIFIPLSEVKQGNGETFRCRVFHPGTGHWNSYIAATTTIDRDKVLKKVVWEIMRVASAEKFVASQRAAKLLAKFEGK